LGIFLADHAGSPVSFRFRAESCGLRPQHHQGRSAPGSLCSGLDADLLDGQHASAFATAGHNHNAAYLGITAKAADAEKLDGFDSTAFVRSVNGAVPDANGNATATVDLSGRVAKSGDTMSGHLTMTSGANIISSRPGDDARNTGFKMSDGQDLGEMNRSTQYTDDRANNCNGYLPAGNCAGNSTWTPSNGNWWTWSVSGVPTSNCANSGSFDGARGNTSALTAVSVGYNYDVIPCCRRDRRCRLSPQLPQLQLRRLQLPH
jgi:hypothetical protein